jgi:hypothetical protein
MDGEKVSPPGQRQTDHKHTLKVMCLDRKQEGIGLGTDCMNNPMAITIARVRSLRTRE